MKRALRGLLAPIAATAVTLCLAGGPAPALAATAEADSDGIIVTYATQGDAGISLQSGEGMNVALSDAGLEVTGRVVQDMGQVTVTAQPTAGQSIDEAVEDALAVDGVIAAQPNYLYELVDDVDGNGSLGPDVLPTAGEGPASGIRLQAAATFNDPIAQVSSSDTSPNQYWLYTAHFASAWDKREANRAVTVAVLDGPIDVTHEDLAANVLSNQAYDAISDTPHVTNMASVDASFDNAHATHVAGIISGVANNGRGIAGASYNANILPVMVIGRGDDGSTVGSTATVLAGLDYVKSLAVSDNIRVVSLSLRLTANPSSATDDAVHTAIVELRDSYDIVTVCAGGNYRASNAANHAITDPSYPADYDECVSVTALDAQNQNWADSEYNQYKDISAPGVSVWSTWYSSNGYGSNGPYASKTGTSMAAPMVSAAFALLFADNPTATVDEACQGIYQTADEISYTSSERDQERERLSGTHGALDADEAVSYLEAHAVARKTFSDVTRGEWFWRAVRYATDNGIMHGYDSGTFGPNDGLTREQAAAVMYNYLAKGATAPACPQADVLQGEWYASCVNWVVANHVMSGYGDQAFGVGDDLSREQIAAVVANAVHANVASESTARLDAMPDASSVSDWARQSVAWALNHGVISGVDSDGTRYVRPLESVTRAEIAAIMMNAIQAGLL